MADLDIAPFPLRRCTRCNILKPETLEHYSFLTKRGIWAYFCRRCAVEVQQIRYYANPEPIREYNRQRYYANRERNYAQARQWRLDNPDRYRAYTKVSSARKWQKLRAEMITAYGSCCSCCGLSEHVAIWLTLEHLRRDGAAHRARCGNQNRVILELRELGWPKDNFTILCWNCQTTSWYGGACAHTPEYQPPQPKNQVERNAIIDACGARCACCGLTDPRAFLCIKRPVEKESGYRPKGNGNIYREILRRGFPLNDTVFCYNCRMARAFHGSCPHERGRQLALGLGEVA